LGKLGPIGEYTVSKFHKEYQQVDPKNYELIVLPLVVDIVTSFIIDTAPPEISIKDLLQQAIGKAFETLEG
jgi:hypothetical protein